MTRDFNLPPGVTLRDLEPEAPDVMEEQHNQAMNSAHERAKEFAIEQMIERHVHREITPHIRG